MTARAVPDDPAALAARLLDGDRRALARALTWVEDGAATRLRGLLAALRGRDGGAHHVGVTGPPGVGKSTLVSALLHTWRRRGRSVAVVAVDPSSPYSGGALLGDRVRMQDHVLDAGVFVRSMASRGHLGGLSLAAPTALAVCDAAGFDVVVLETVGVGQAEVEVASVADTTLVVLAPGLGDAVQAAKAGVLEIADVFAVNKADRDGAARTVRELRDMQHLGADRVAAPIVSTVAATGAGVDDLADALEEHRRALDESGDLGARQVARAVQRVEATAQREVLAALRAIDGGDALRGAAEGVVAGHVDPAGAVQSLLRRAVASPSVLLDR